MAADKEIRLVRRLKNGDINALEWLYKTHSEKLLNQAFRIMLSRQAAEDVLHDIFVRLPESLKRFRGEAALQTWLYRVTHNTCLERLRTKKNHLRLLNQTKESPPQSAGTTFEDKDMLSRALAILDEETRSLLWLKEGEGLEVKELSRIFGLPEGTVKSRLSRGREKMQKWIAKEAVHAV
jgi:RNA polymerase sigma-70 factor (ECF subfamily)